MDMRKLLTTMIIIATVASLGVALVPPVLADTISGEVTVSNNSPEVLGFDVGTDPVDPETYFWVNVEVRDNDTLSDIENVVLEIYENSDTPGMSANKNKHYWFWFNPSDNSWHSDPNTNVQGDAFIDSAASEYPADLSVDSDNYNFKILLNGTASDANDWHVIAEAEDASVNVGSANEVNAFSVNTYLTYAVGTDGTINWTNLATGTDNNASDDNPINVENIETNVSWDLQNKLENTQWKNDTDSFGADNAKFNSTNDSSTATQLSTTFQDVVSAQSEGEDLSESFYYWIDIPEDVSGGTYTNNFIIEVAQN